MKIFLIGKEKKVKRVLTMTKLKQLAPRMKDFQLPKSTRILLKTVLFRRPPVEIGISLIAIFLMVGMVAPHIPASALTQPVSKATIAIAMLNPPVDENVNEFDPYKTDNELVSSEVLYSQALKADVERRFYLDLVHGNRRVLEAIYTYSGDLNKDFVFALLLQESEGDPAAHNDNLNKAGIIVSTDYGLFQLNSKSYPNLTEEQLLQIETNVKYGIGHIRGELKYWNGNVRKALWTYNAGQNGILDGVPKRTIAYATEIIADTRAIAARRDQYIKANLGKYLASATDVTPIKVATRD